MGTWAIACPTAILRHRLQGGSTCAQRCDRREGHWQPARPGIR